MAGRPGKDHVNRRVFSSLFTHRPHVTPRFTNLPPPRDNASPFHLDLKTILSTEMMTSINKSKKIGFHTVGDTGNNGYPTYQNINTESMQDDINNPSRNIIPFFFYHLGDVVYQFGEPIKYYDQFYYPYEEYPNAIIGIPGNHDGLPASGNPKDSLKGFIDNFCAEQPEISNDAHGIHRDAMTQPYVYWTLDAPYVTIIGLYSNTDEYEGQFDQDQLKWFVNELNSASKDKALIVTVHHPAYSGDSSKGSSKNVAKVLDKAFDDTNRYADMVLSGHVHNYQRFTRVINGDYQLPYIVAGAGGYPAKHYMLKHPTGVDIQVPYKIPSNEVDITLENYNDTRFGYLIISVDESNIAGQYIATAYHREAFHADPTQIDSFQVNWRDHKLVRGGSV
jgi:acid phosphatase type 7